MTLTGRIGNETKFKTAFVETTYGIERYQASPYAINIVVFGAATALNLEKLGKGLKVPSNFSIMDVNDAYIGYFEDYLLLGMTPFFKKLHQPIPQKTKLASELPTTISNKYGNKTNVVELDKAIDYFSKRFLDKLSAKYQETELKMRHLEDAEFAEFERKRDTSCPEGRCEYISQIIDEFEGILPKSDEF